jgi:hypothetical protein
MQKPTLNSLLLFASLGFYLLLVLNCGGSESNKRTEPPKNASEVVKELPPEDLKQEVRRRDEEAENAIKRETPIAPDTDLFIESPLTRKAGPSAPSKSEEVLRDVDTSYLKQVIYDKEKSIYGDTDNRKDLCDVGLRGDKTVDQFKRAKINVLARSVAGIMYSDQLLGTKKGTYLIKTEPFRKRHQLCSNESFADQPTVMWCSAVLVAPNLLATAGHCVNGRPLADLRFIFNWGMIKKGDIKTTVTVDSVYRATRILGMNYTLDAADWALVELDRAVSGVQPVKIRRQDKIRDFEDVYVLGHPCGLPMKYADGAKVRTNTDDAFFVANLDTFSGNSGSPVFNYSDDTLEGILVRGEPDFDHQPEGCYKARICPYDGCSGESCTRASLFANLIPLQ